MWIRVDEQIHIVLSTIAGLDCCVVGVGEKIGENRICHGCYRRLRTVSGHTRMEHVHTRMGDYLGEHTRRIRNPVPWKN